MINATSGQEFLSISYVSSGNCFIENSIRSHTIVNLLNVSTPIHTGQPVEKEAWQINVHTDKLDAGGDENVQKGMKRRGEIGESTSP
jgi:hypothetical protein